MPFERLTLHLPPELKTRLAKAAAREGCSMTALATRAIDQLVGAEARHMISLPPHLWHWLQTVLQARTAQGEVVTLPEVCEELLTDACQQAELAREEGRR